MYTHGIKQQYTHEELNQITIDRVAYWHMKSLTQEAAEYMSHYGWAVIKHASEVATQQGVPTVRDRLFPD